MAVALVVGVLGTTEGSWWLRSIFLEPRAFVVTVDLSVENERLKLTQEINCIPYLRWEGLASFRAWRPAIRQFGERLKSGGAVIVTTPGILCGPAHLEQDERSKGLAIPEGHIPYIKWVDNADRPGLIEAYVSKDYFSRSNPRVRFHGMTARAIPYDSSYPAEDPFDWSSKPRSDWDAQDHLGMFPGFYAWPIMEEQWSKDDTIAGYVRPLDEAQVLPPDISSKMEKFYGIIDHSWFLIGRGLPPGPGVDGVYRHRDSDLNLGRLLPLSKRGISYETKPQEQGYIAYYRSEEDKPNISWPTIEFVVGDSTLPVQTSEMPAVYDPTTKTIYRIETVWASFPVRDVE